MDIKKIEVEMRKFENDYTHTINPGTYMIVRLDGQGFSKLTKKNFEKPFDQNFQKAMIKATLECMNCGFRVIYAYTASDEISLLIHKDDYTYGRKIRKIISLLASAAAARFSLETGIAARFDGRVMSFITPSLVAYNFLWRMADCERNALNNYCYWSLRKTGMTAGEATSKLKNLSTEDKKILLFNNGIIYNELPLWTRKGVGIYKEKVMVEGVNPITNEKENVLRNKIKVNVELPKEYSEYGNFILKLIEESES